MQIPRWRNLLFLKNSLSVPTLSLTHYSASFHSTPTSCEKWKNKWNAIEANRNNLAEEQSNVTGKDVSRPQQPTKSYVRYQTRQKRADAKRALKDLLFRSGSSKISFQDDNPIWKFDGKNGFGDKSDTKSQPKSSSCRFGKTDRKRMKRKSRRESFPGDFDDPESTFQGRFGNRWYTWTYQSQEGSSFQSSDFGFEWREHSNRTNHKTEDWKSTREADSDDELFSVGSCSDRTILGLPPRGPLKIEDVKTAFRFSALKWHPDKHQGPSQAMAEEKFKLCVNAYKSLCDALSCV